jgi:hypothetical protein
MNTEQPGKTSPTSVTIGGCLRWLPAPGTRLQSSRCLSSDSGIQRVFARSEADLADPYVRIDQADLHVD